MVLSNLFAKKLPSLDKSKEKQFITNYIYMKKILTILAIVLLASCDKGDFEIPSFQFEETVQDCGTYIVYRTNSEDTEALVLVMNSTVIKSEETTTPLKLYISATNLQYRLFDGAIGTDYFCQTLPPITPTVIKNWTGVAGADNYIQVETTKYYNSSDVHIGYKHYITLHNMKLENGSDSIMYESFEFGTFTTGL